MSSSSPRRGRVAQALRAALSELIEREVKDPRVRAAGLFSINHVDLNADMSVARIAVSFPLADDAAVDDAMTGLVAAAGYLRGPVGRRLHLKRPPELRFLRDDTLELQERIAAIAHDDQVRHVATEPPSAVEPAPTDSSPDTSD